MFLLHMSTQNDHSMKKRRSSYNTSVIGYLKFTVVKQTPEYAQAILNTRRGTPLL